MAHEVVLAQFTIISIDGGFENALEINNPLQKQM